MFDDYGFKSDNSGQLLVGVPSSQKVMVAPKLVGLVFIELYVASAK